jgi:hypothetical protein
MKSKIKNQKSKILTGLAVLASVAVIVCAALADSPTYKNFVGSSAGSSTTVFAVADPQTQIRVVGSICESDNAASILTFYPGAAAYSVGQLNTNLTATNIIVNATNGLAANGIICYQDAARTTNISLTIGGIVNSTNIYTTAVVGITQKVGDDVFLEGTSTAIAVGKGTNLSLQGEAIFVAPKGRPIRAVVSGSTSWSKENISVHYDQ